MAKEWLYLDARDIFDSVRAMHPPGRVEDFDEMTDLLSEELREILLSQDAEAARTGFMLDPDDDGWGILVPSREEEVDGGDQDEEDEGDETSKELSERRERLDVEEWELSRARDAATLRPWKAAREEHARRVEEEAARKAARAAAREVERRELQ